jgi:hypothetical protein
MPALPELPLPDAAAFAEIRERAEPVVLRGLVADWPIVAAARSGELGEWMSARATQESLPMVRAPAAEYGRLHYRAALDRPNFEREPATIAGFFADVERQNGQAAPDTLAIQGFPAERAVPGFRQSHPMPLVPDDAEPRFWLGTPAIVATHHDTVENLACVAAGRRRFTLFPPEQVANLYMGPFHITPAGTAVSMAHVTAPDLDRFPKFAEALAVAQTAELDAGDAIYIPYGWYHHVEALSPVNLLVNYWWNPARRDVGSPWDALMHGMVALRQLPPDQRRMWRAMFDHYVFKSDADPAAHLPEAFRGILGAESPADLTTMRKSIIAALEKVDKAEHR